ncbi:tRNA-specific adenosine deaminase TAD3-like isoform X2 [Apium graveolens]|uniref:tRNA-specific adenosine deaminase TAD3-like isoform X2 n=1 Tax=Apium graveolens TaxID=4045 RepID=UPI003D7B92B5
MFNYVAAQKSIHTTESLQVTFKAPSLDTHQTVQMPSTGGDIENEESWKILHIPDKPPVPPLLQPTVNVYASVINPKHANTLIRKLNKISLLEDLRHVKRIRKRCVEGNVQLLMILCPASHDSGQLEDIPSDIAELIESYQLSTFITKVSKYPATSKEEWEEQCKLWPTSYHPPTYNIDGITGFSEENSQSILEFMKFAVDLAKSFDGQIVNAAVIVNPTSNQVVARSCDQVFSQSNTSTRNSIGAGYLEPCETTSSPSIISGLQSNTSSTSNFSFNTQKRTYSDVSCLHPWQWAEQQSQASCFRHPFHHAAMVAIENSASRDRYLFPTSEHVGDKCCQADFVDSPLTVSPSKRQKTNTNVEDSGMQNGETNACGSTPERPYLCTGYDIYLVWEPCIMCAMALVHQRIKRIFYAFPNPNAGALGSLHRLQGEKSLNHHYAVFRVFLPEAILDRGDVTTATSRTDQNNTQV